MENIFLQISLLLVIAVAIAFIVRLMKQPLIIAYIVTGITAGPMFFNILHQDKNMYEAFAQFGVVLLLFIIGLNLNFRHLKSIGKVSFITGVGQVIFTAIIGFLLLTVLKLPPLSAGFLAVAITFSSTIIIMKLLIDKKDTETVYGKYTIGLMLVQDIIAVLLMIGVGVFTNSEANNSLITLLIKGLAVIVLIVLLAKYVLPWFLNKIAHSAELLFIFTVAWCFGLASLLYLAGFSLEIGAIVAGLSLSSSPYQLEIGSRIKPLRDFFLILFFIVLGSTMSFGALSAIWLPSLILSLFILIGNPLILYLLFRMLKFTRRNSFLAGVTAAQVSEFGFVILFTGSRFGYLQENTVTIFTVVAIVTIFISSYLIINNEKIYRFLLPLFNLFGPDKYQQREKLPIVYEAWVIGHHRIGIKVCQALKAIKKSFAVIDYDPQAIAHLHKNKIPAVFGDVADVEFLAGLPLAGAKLIVITIPSLEDQLNLLVHVKVANPDIMVIANAYQPEEVKTLYEAGADYVMMPHALGGDWIAGILQNKKLSKTLLAKLKTEQAV